MLTSNREPTDKDLIDSIRAGGSQRELAWQSITKTWGASAMGVAIGRSNCDAGQAKEAFSMACVGVDNRIRTTAQADFLGKASLKTYLTQATIYAAFAILRKQPRTQEFPAKDETSGNEHEQLIRSAHCKETMGSALGNIGSRCKQILLLFANGYSMEEIRIEMGFDNPDVARREKYKCQERFKTYLRENPAVQRQLVENCYG